MHLNTLTDMFPITIKRRIGQLLSVSFLNRLFLRLSDFEVDLLKLIHRNKEYYPFTFEKYLLVGNVKFIKGTKDTQIYKILRTIMEHIDINEKTLFFDIGANIGLTSVIMAEYVKPAGARVIAFEPGDQIKYLHKNMCLTNNEDFVHIEEKALFNRNTVIKLYTYNESIVDSRIYNDNDWLRANKGKIKKKLVETTTFDDYLKANDIDPARIKLIKIDCQGAEPFIFEKMFETVVPSNKLSIIFEYWPYSIRKLQNVDPDDFIVTVYDKFNCFNFYYIHNEDVLTKIEGCDDLKKLTTIVGNGPNQFCDILITMHNMK